jgi:hypothetical protein
VFFLNLQDLWSICVGGGVGIVGNGGGGQQSGAGAKGGGVSLFSVKGYIIYMYI